MRGKRPRRGPGARRAAFRGATQRPVLGSFASVVRAHPREEELSSEERERWRERQAPIRVKVSRLRTELIADDVVRADSGFEARVLGVIGRAAQPSAAQLLRGRFRAKDPRLAGDAVGATRHLAGQGVEVWRPVVGDLVSADMERFAENALTPEGPREEGERILRNVLEFTFRHLTGVSVPGPAAWKE